MFAGAADLPDASMSYMCTTALQQSEVRQGKATADFLIKTTCTLCMQGGSQRPLEGSGLQELLLTFLRLRLDPIGQLLAVELHVSPLLVWLEINLRLHCAPQQG